MLYRRLEFGGKSVSAITGDGVRVWSKYMSKIVVLPRFGPGLACAAVIAVITALVLGRPLWAQTGPAAGPGYTIAVHVSSSPTESGPEEVYAIRDFVARRADMINQQGGVKGRELKIKFFDDKTDVNKTIDNVDRALEDDRLLAMVGIWNSTRGAQVMDKVGASGKALISELSVEDLFASHRNIYTLTRAVSDEEDVFVAFAKDKFQRLAFIGLENDLYTKAFHRRLSAPDAQVPMVFDTWIEGQVEDNEDKIAQAISDIKSSNADILFLSVGSSRGARILKRFAASGIDIPVFIALGSINGVVTHESGGGRAYQGAYYEIAEGGIANLNNERLEQLMRSPHRMPAVRTYSPYAVGYGARYADLVAMLAELAEAAPSANPSRMADYIVDELARLRKGQRVWRGWAQDWTFTAARSSGEHSLLVWRPEARLNSILAPEQYIRRDGQVQPVPVLYVHLDMVSISHVDSNDRSFEAEFFFTMRANKQIPISAIEFTNAVRGGQSAKPLISVRRVYEETDAGGDDLVSRIYKVSGRFRFEPDLRKYPFDEQVFSISFQPATMDAAFFLQPPSDELRADTFAVDGWKIRSHYVGTNELIIRSIGNATGGEKVLPYYNFNYTWVMQRQVTDYLLRVIVPLAFIMIVAYVAHFIPTARFEAIMGIQVTALLSAIALYLALNQPASDNATLSDIIFVMAYASITAMIALSVLEVNQNLLNSMNGLRIINFVQVYVVPVIAMGLIAYILISAANPVTLQRLWNAVWPYESASALLPGSV